MELTLFSSMNREQLKALLAETIKEFLAEGIDSHALKSMSADPDNERMIDVKEAAAITGLAVNTIYDKTHRREIPHYKKGKRLYIRPSELLAWIANARVMTQDEIDAKAISHVMGHPLDSRQTKKGPKGK